MNDDRVGKQNQAFGRRGRKVWRRPDPAGGADRHRRMLNDSSLGNPPVPQRTLLLAALLAAPLAGAAQMPTPGLWQIGAQTQAVGVPIALSPMAIEHCLTADDARDPSRLLGRLSSPGATGCAYTDSAYSGSNFHFTMECTGIFGIKATGDVTFTATSLTGAIASTATINGQAVEMRSTLSARRLGECPAARP